MTGKRPARSKTLWVAALVAVAPILPISGPWIKAHQTEYNQMLGVLMVGLRLSTREPITTGPKPKEEG